MTVLYGKNDSEELIKMGGMNKPPFVNPMNKDYNFTGRAEGQTPMGESGESDRKKHASGDCIQDGSGQNQQQSTAPYNLSQPAQNPYEQSNERQPYAVGGVAKLRLGYPDTIGQSKGGHLNSNVD